MTSRQTLARRLLRRDRLSALVDLVRRPEAVVQSVSRELTYLPDETFRAEVAGRRSFMRDAFHYLGFNGIRGDYAEFGCNGAMTFRLAWSAAKLASVDTHFWGFDSFAGLPELADARDEHPKWVPGTMATSLAQFEELCRDHGIPRESYTAVAGIYSETLAAASGGARPTDIALAYVDCDYYSSTKDVLEFLSPRLRTGMLIAFDDWFCYGPESVSGERLAAQEFFGAGGRFALVPYIQFGWHGMSFVVEATNSKGATPAES